MGAGADKAAATMGVAAAAANAIPVAGMFVSAGLGLVAGLTKAFAGQGPKKRRRARRAEGQRVAQQGNDLRKQAADAQAGQGAGIQTGQDPDQGASTIPMPTINVSEFIPGEDFAIQDNPFLGIIDNG